MPTCSSQDPFATQTPPPPKKRKPRNARTYRFENVVVPKETGWPVCKEATRTKETLRHREAHIVRQRKVAAVADAVQTEQTDRSTASGRKKPATDYHCVKQDQGQKLGLGLGPGL